MSTALALNFFVLLFFSSLLNKLYSVANVLQIISFYQLIDANYSANTTIFLQALF
jgi:hypothetical protein